MQDTTNDTRTYLFIIYYIIELNAINSVAAPAAVEVNMGLEPMFKQLNRGGCYLYII